MKQDFNKKFYARKDGKVVAVKFEELHIWFDAREPESEKEVSYKMKFADGTESKGYYCSLPEIYGSVDDAISGNNPVSRYFSLKDYIHLLGFTPSLTSYTDIFGKERSIYKAWRWDGFQPVYEYISEGGPCRSSLWYNALTEQFEFPTKMYYETYEKCKEANHIDVVDF